MGYKKNIKKLYIADLRKEVSEDGQVEYLVKIGTWGSKEALERFYGPTADPYYNQNFPDIKIAASIVGKVKNIVELEQDLLKETEDCYCDVGEVFSGCTEIRKLNPLQRKNLLDKIYNLKDKVVFF